MDQSKISYNTNKRKYFNKLSNNFKTLLINTSKLSMVHLFIHTTTKLLLKKKKDIKASWKDLLGISIMRAVLITLNKLTPITQAKLNPLKQQWRKKTANNNITKLAILYNANQKGKNSTYRLFKSI